MMPSSAVSVAALVAGALAVNVVADSGATGRFLTPLKSATDKASTDASRPTSGEKGLRADAATLRSCCSGCPGSAYCSPVSGTCYAWQNKHYYHTCSAPSRTCCSGCPGSAYCSPVSGKCYAWMNKAYYETCAANAAADSSYPGDFLELVKTANETASPNANLSTSGEIGLRADSSTVRSCCSGCPGSAYCSPVSGTCYAWKNKHYYQTCSALSRTCCSGCPGSAYCSPVSGKCYAWMNKAYYETCAANAAADSSVPGDFLELVKTANETASPNANQSTSMEDGLRADAAVLRRCCSGCPGSAYCSPVSGTCYAWQNKHYYLTCSAPSRTCCSGCPGSAYCSPVSGACYAWKNKDYYEACHR